MHGGFVLLEETGVVATPLACSGPENGVGCLFLTQQHDIVDSVWGSYWGPERNASFQHDAYSTTTLTLADDGTFSTSDTSHTSSDTATDVTSRRHATVSLNDLQRQVLNLLDGTRDRASATQELTARVHRGALVLHEGGQRVSEPAAAERLVAQSLERVLQSLAQRALLAL